MKEKKVKNPDNRVGLGRLALWQTSSVSVALSTLVLGYVNIYCTDTLHLDILIVGTIFMLSKIVDAVTDMVVGVIIDRTNTRWGRAARTRSLCCSCGWPHGCSSPHRLLSPTRQNTSGCS